MVGDNGGGVTMRQRQRFDGGKKNVRKGDGGEVVVIRCYNCGRKR